MSDWSSVRYKKKPEKEHTGGVNFVYEDDEDDDYDDDVPEEQSVEEIKPIEEVKPVETISEERMHEIVFSIVVCKI